MKMVRRTIPIPEDLYNSIELLAKQNYRTFNLEIAKALDFYIKSCKGQSTGVDIQVSGIQEVLNPINVCPVVNETMCEYEDIEVDEI